MTTTITLTGTGVPHPSPGRAGPGALGTPFEAIFDYHADTVALGELAEAAGVRHLVLTHLIPPPTNRDDVEAFAADVRSGGYTGELTVGEDLLTATIG